jgi:hypothetical protein
MKELNLPQLNRGAQPGHNNHNYKTGRRIDRSGYVLVTAPDNHPYARKRTNRENWIILEHRLVMEHKMGRYLLPEEVVDHIDGLTLHNHPDNLRIFSENGNHLRDTLRGLPKEISLSGRRNLSTKHLQLPEFQRVDIYDRRKKRGDVRLRQILLAALQFGIDSPYLLGTHHHLEKKQIDWSSRSNLKLALDALLQRWEQDLAL